MLKLLFIFIFSSALFGCASEDKKGDTPEEAFKIAKEYEDDDRYQIALQRYLDVKNKFPYSSFATLAELAIADVHYKNEDYPEAQVSYQNFREFHPKHPKVDYVIFRTGLSYYMQLPDSIDRDLTLANDAIYNFNELIKKYPTSSYVAEAEDYRRKALVMLNEKELYVADFYYMQEYFDSALSRYESAYKKFTGVGLEPRALAGAIKCAAQLDNKEKQKTYTEILTQKFSDSSEAKEIKQKGLE
jgi:outer membrane protein assembly factor BamD